MIVRMNVRAKGRPFHSHSRTRGSSNLQPMTAIRFTASTIAKYTQLKPYWMAYAHTKKATP
jgi:hypothetical protein